MPGEMSGQAGQAGQEDGAAVLGLPGAKTALQPLPDLLPILPAHHSLSFYLPTTVEIRDVFAEQIKRLA